MMFSINNNTLLLNGKKFQYENHIEKVIDFHNLVVVYLLDEDVPENNIFALGDEGEILWNISDIIKLEYPEAYISVGKTSNNTISVISYNGVKTEINVFNKNVISKSITK
ncbi:MAG: hypothetical protein ACYCX2_12245 [Christensenellales bacterium]